MKVKELFSNLWAPGWRQVILYFQTYPGEKEIYRGPISEKFLKDYGEAEVRTWFPGILEGICVETDRPLEEDWPNIEVVKECPADWDSPEDEIYDEAEEADDATD